MKTLLLIAALALAVTAQAQLEPVGPVQRPNTPPATLPPVYHTKEEAREILIFRAKEAEDQATYYYQQGVESANTGGSPNGHWTMSAYFHGLSVAYYAAAELLISPPPPPVVRSYRSRYFYNFRR